MAASVERTCRFGSFAGLSAASARGPAHPTYRPDPTENNKGKIPIYPQMRSARAPGPGIDEVLHGQGSEHQGDGFVVFAVAVELSFRLRRRCGRRLLKRMAHQRKRERETISRCVKGNADTGFQTRSSSDSAKVRATSDDNRGETWSAIGSHKVTVKLT